MTTAASMGTWTRAGFSSTQPHSIPQPWGLLTCNLPKFEQQQEPQQKATPATAAPGHPPAWNQQGTRGWATPAPPAQPRQHCSASRNVPPRAQTQGMYLLPQDAGPGFQGRMVSGLRSSQFKSRQRYAEFFFCCCFISFLPFTYKSSL